MLELNNLYLMDCMDGMAEFPDGFFDLAIVDPQYGRKEHGGRDRGKYVRQRNESRAYVKGGYQKKDWDNAPPDQSYFDELFRVSQNQIIWGENYFHTFFGPGRIIWDKCNSGTDQSDCEIAYNSMTDRVDLFRFMWRGMMQGRSITEGHIQQGNKALNEKHIHPTQKPVALYKWQLITYAKTGWRILDTHVGSASSLVACHELGFDYVGFEKDRDYFADARDRLDAVRAQLSMRELISQAKGDWQINGMRSL